MTHKEFVDSIRQIADFYERHEELPLPDLDPISVYDWGKGAKEMVVNAARALGTCEKEADSSVTYGVYKDFGSIRLRFVGGKDQICTKKVVGTKRVEAYYSPSTYIAAHDEEIVEWECPESLLAESQADGDPTPLAVLALESLGYEIGEAPATTTNSPNPERPDVDSGDNQENG